MLNKPVIKGDRVVISRRDGFSRFCREPFEATVESIGRKYITADGYKFDFEGRDKSHDPSVFELWNSLEDYQEARDRAQIISKIRNTQWRDLDKLPTESLKTILELMEVK